MRATAVVMVVLSAMSIAAHFLRSADYVLAAVGVLIPALLIVRKRFAVRLVQVLLALAALEWLRTLATIAMERSAQGLPWARMALILGAVAALAIAAAALINPASGPPDKGG